MKAKFIVQKINILQITIITWSIAKATATGDSSDIAYWPAGGTELMGPSGVVPVRVRLTIRYRRLNNRIPNADRDPATYEMIAVTLHAAQHQNLILCQNLLIKDPWSLCTIIMYRC